MGLHGRDDGTLEHDARLDGRWPTRIEFDESEADPRASIELVKPEGECTIGPEPVTFFGRDGTAYHVDYLDRIFDTVCDENDWKAPISAVIPPRTFAVVDTAVEFFTATRIRAIGIYPDGSGRILVEADGYRAGPAGDH